MTKPDPLKNVSGAPAIPPIQPLPTATIDGIEHGFEVEGELAERPRRRPSVLVVSLVVGFLLAVAASLFDFL